MSRLFSRFIAIRRQAERLVVEIESDARKDDAAAPDEIASVCQRLTQLYPHGARLSVASGTRPWLTVLEIPRPHLASAQ